jgi:hypothetical protein
MLLLNGLKKLVSAEKTMIAEVVGSMSDEDKAKVKAFAEELLKVAVAGAVQGAMSKVD